MTAFILGAVGALLFVVVLIGGVALGFALSKRLHPVPQPVDPEVRTIEEVREERKRLKAQQEAFRTLQNYSAEMAYGLTTDPLRPGG